jgi:hypothetical protein
MTKIVTKSFTETLLKIVVILVGLYLFTELIEGLIGYDGITMLQAAVVDALLAGTVPGFLLVGGIGVLAGAMGVLAVLWVLGRI